MAHLETAAGVMINEENASGGSNSTTMTRNGHDHRHDEDTSGRRNDTNCLPAAHSSAADNSSSSLFRPPHRPHANLAAPHKDCCLSNKLRLLTNDSTGFLYLHCAIGPVIMSNIFLSTALITLAETELGCQGDEDSCGTIYGFKPSSLIAIIATVSGILSSFFLPFVGAIVDYTPHRHLTGVMASIILVAIQAIQIYTVESTWFFMSILQAINGFVYQVVSLAGYAYLPEIVGSVSEKTFQWYSSLYYMVMFGHELLYLLVMAAIAISFGTNDVVTAQISQGLDTVVTGGYFVLTWYYFTQKEAKARLPDNSNASLLGAGFQQVFRTAAGLYQYYPKTVGNFFLGCIFAEAGINSFTTVSVTYINEVLKFNSTQISILFLIVLTCTIPGSYFANWLANRTNPMVAFKLQIVTFIVVNFVGFLILKDPSMEIAAYVMGIFWGFWIGWYYPLEKLIYSLVVPKGQESELAGFFLYCTQILTFLPPLVFALMNEADINLKWGGIHLNIYMMIGLVFFHLMLPWSDCLEAAKVNAMREQGVVMDQELRVYHGAEMDGFID